MITSDDFARWRDDNVTQFVFAAVAAGAKQQQDAWLETSWGMGTAKPELLRELRTRADAYYALIDTTYEGWCENNGVEPVYEK